MKTVSAIVEQINRTTNTLKQSLREHRYFQARGLLGRLVEMPILVADIERVRETIDARCSKATALARRGVFETNRDSALAKALLRRSLQVCTDCTEADESLKNLDERQKQVPRLETEFLKALAKGKASTARASLTALLQRVSLSSDELAEITAQLRNIEEARTTVRWILCGLIVAVAIVAIVTAILIGARGT